MIRIVHVDAYKIVLEVVARALEGCDDLKIVGRGTRLNEAFQLVESIKPDILLCNTVLEDDIIILEHLQSLKALQPTMKVLLFTSLFSKAVAARCLNENIADAYLPINLKPCEIESAIRRSSEGLGTFYAPLIRSLQK